jgi:hypothetical protein
VFFELLDRNRSGEVGKAELFERLHGMRLVKSTKAVEKLWDVFGIGVR